jgi:hypothetical protein
MASCCGVPLLPALISCMLLTSMLTPSWGFTTQCFRCRCCSPFRLPYYCNQQLHSSGRR